MKDDVIVWNIGHLDLEIDMKCLNKDTVEHLLNNVEGEHQATDGPLMLKI